MRRGLRVCLASAVVATVVPLGAPTAWSAPQKAPSLGPAPVRLNDFSCSEWGDPGARTCVSDIWGGNFDFRLSAHVVRVGQEIGGTVSDGTANYGHSWSWGDAPGKVVSCRPGAGASTPGPSSGHCTWKTTAPAEYWAAASACINPLGQVYCEEDYYAVLDHRYLLHGFVRDADGKGIGGAKVTFTRGSEASFATTRGDGYYDAILKRGTYAVRAAGKGKLCATQRPRCENPTEVKLVTDKQLDFGPPSAVVVAGHLRDHRGKGLAGVTVEAAAVGKSERYRDTTDSSGSYRLELPGGAYNVRPVPADRTNREKWLPATTYVEQAQGSVTKDFQLAAADELDLATSASRLIGGLWWTTAAASGGGSADGTVTIENGRGDPVTDEPVTVDAPYWDVPPAGSAAPEAVICDENWRRVYPGDGFERTTDGQGAVRFHMFFGGVVGNFYLHSRETRDVTVLDVERFAQLGSVMGPNEDIVTTLQNAQKLGLPKAPLAGATQAKVQQGLLDWLLTYRLGGAPGPNGQSPWGEFGPIRSVDGSRGGIVLYPSGNPGPLRAHLATGAPLPAGYTTLAIPIKRVVVLAQETWYVDFSGGSGGLKSLGAWEGSFGPARAGFAGGQGATDVAWFGGPYPPPAANAEARAGFDRCVPGAAPQVTAIEVHSPVRLLLDDGAGHRFGYDRRGRLVNTIGGYVVPAKGSRPTTYVVPSGSYSAAITGTGRGAATLVVRTTSSAGDTVRVFSVRARRGAKGTLRLTARGAARTLRFGGATVRARNGVGLRARGLPKRLAAGRRARLAVRVTSQFGRAVAGALVAAGGRGIDARAVTNARGRAAITFTAPRSGRVRIRVSAPGYATVTRLIRVRKRA